MFVSARASRPLAASTSSRRSAPVASGTAPDPSTTSPPSPRPAAISRSRAPNGRPSGGPARISARFAPASRNPRRCRSATSSRAAAVTRMSGPAFDPGSGCRIATSTSVMCEPGASLGHPSSDSKVLSMSASRTVRAYVGLGANVGDAAETLASAIVALDEIAGDPRHRRLAAVRDRAVGRHRPARVPECCRRVRRPDRRPRTRRRGARAAWSAQDPRAPRRSAPPSALGTARARSRPAGLRAPSHRCRAAPRGPLDRRRRGSGQGGKAPPGPAPRPRGAAVRARDRWPISRHVSFPRVGPRRSSRGVAASLRRNRRAASESSASGIRRQVPGGRRPSSASGSARPPCRRPR